ncbi:MAG: GTP-binding protein [Oscillospiraceae bacterium]|nr:GTP-binding protein [Oscillospiraceae bacterium]
MAVPVYLFTGFLEAGKTKFIQETLEDDQFGNGDKTLILLCEEGGEEYNPKAFAANNNYIVTVEEQEQLTTAFLKECEKKYHVDRVLIEYNGMWMTEPLFEAMPKNWEVYQEIMIADSTTFQSYLNNMRQLMVDKLQGAEMVIFNRCTPQTDKALFHRAVRMVNRRAEMAFERTDGSVDYDDIVDELPFDLSGDAFTVEDTDFGLWYLDALDHPEKYKGKTVTFKAYVCLSGKAPRGSFIAGRFCMTCCADDITFIGFITKYDKVAQLEERQWVDVSAKIAYQYHPIYEGDGPVLTVQTLTPAQAPKEELVYFS